MRRREFIGLISGAVAWPLAARAQQPSAKVFRIGFLGSATADNLPKRPEAFRAGLRDLGYQEGRDFVIEYRWADGNYDRLPALIADLARLNVDVIVTHGTPAALAAKTATTIPVVLAVVADPLGSGIVSSLARPGGNVTGLTYFQPELAAKRLELLKEIMPGLTDVGILLNSTNPANEPIVPHMSGSPSRSSWSFTNSACAQPPISKELSRRWQPSVSARSWSSTTRCCFPTLQR